MDKDLKYLKRKLDWFSSLLTALPRHPDYQVLKLDFKPLEKVEEIQKVFETSIKGGDIDKFRSQWEVIRNHGAAQAVYPYLISLLSYAAAIEQPELRHAFYTLLLPCAGLRAMTKAVDVDPTLHDFLVIEARQNPDSTLPFKLKGKKFECPPKLKIRNLPYQLAVENGNYCLLMTKPLIVRVAMFRLQLEDWQFPDKETEIQEEVNNIRNNASLVRPPPPYVEKDRDSPK